MPFQETSQAIFIVCDVSNEDLGFRRKTHSQMMLPIRGPCHLAACRFAATKVA
jgi:hypothetical protein